MSSPKPSSFPPTTARTGMPSTIAYKTCPGWAVTGWCWPSPELGRCSSTRRSRRKCSGNPLFTYVRPGVIQWSNTSAAPSPLRGRSCFKTIRTSWTGWSRLPLRCRGRLAGDADVGMSEPDNWAELESEQCLVLAVGKRLSAAGRCASFAVGDHSPRSCRAVGCAAWTGCITSPSQHRSSRPCAVRTQICSGSEILGWPRSAPVRPRLLGDDADSTYAWSDCLVVARRRWLHPIEESFLRKHRRDAPWSCRTRRLRAIVSSKPPSASRGRSVVLQDSKAAPSSRRNLRAPRADAQLLILPGQLAKRTRPIATRRAADPARAGSGCERPARRGLIQHRGAGEIRWDGAPSGVGPAADRERVEVRFGVAGWRDDAARPGPVDSRRRAAAVSGTVCSREHHQDPAG